MKKTIRVTAIAIATLDGQMKTNYERALRLVEISLEQKPDIVLLPEAFAAGYCSDNFTTYAEDRNNDFAECLQQLSAESDCMIVYGYLEKARNGVYNTAVIFDQGRLLGVHHKSNLWPDANRPYRDEANLLLLGEGIEVFDTRFGRIAVVICYENGFEENWRRLVGKVDFVLSPYNMEGDPTTVAIAGNKILKVPNIWANRTGTVWAGNGYVPNLGTAGVLAADGKILACSHSGVEAIVTAEISLTL